MVSGREELIGARGEIIEHADGQWWARVHSEIWKVRSHADLHAGQSVRVTRIDGLVLEVRAGYSDDITRRGDMQGISGIVVLVFIAAVLFYSVRVLREYERGVVFQLGRFWQREGPRTGDRDGP